MSMKRIFEYIYEGINLALDYLESAYLITIVLLGLIVYSRFHSVFVTILVFFIMCIIGSRLLENTFFLIVGFFVMLLIGSLYYTHSLWLFSLFYVALVYTYWYHYGKDPPLGSVKVEYSPGEELDPLTASFLLKEEIDAFDIVATLYNLIRKGHLEVEVQKHDIYLKKRPSDKPLTPPEQFLMDRIFVMTGIEIASMGIRLKENEFPQIVSFGHVLKSILDWLPAMERMIQKHVVEAGFYDFAPVEQKKFTRYLSFILLVVFLGGISLFLPFIMARYKGGEILTNLILPGLMPPVATYVLSLYVTKRTEKGMTAYKRVRGFREFLKRVEKPRLIWLIKQNSVDVEELFVYMVSLRVMGFLEKLKIVLLDFRDLNERIKVYIRLHNFIVKNIKEAIRKRQREKRLSQGILEMFDDAFYL